MASNQFGRNVTPKGPQKPNPASAGKAAAGAKVETEAEEEGETASHEMQETQAQERQEHAGMDHGVHMDHHMGLAKLHAQLADHHSRMAEHHRSRMPKVEEPEEDGKEE